jgi:hypothetical protein
MTKSPCGFSPMSRRAVKMLGSEVVSMEEVRSTWLDDNWKWESMSIRDDDLVMAWTTRWMLESLEAEWVGDAFVVDVHILCMWGICVERQWTSRYVGVELRIEAKTACKLGDYCHVDNIWGDYCHLTHLCRMEREFCPQFFCEVQEGEDQREAEKQQPEM